MKSGRSFACRFAGVAFLILLFLRTSFAALTISDLRCENRTEPLGIDVTEPRLSWVLDSKERGEKQTAYQIVVASTESKLSPGKADLWNSGQVISDQSVQVPYAGKPLTSHTECFWRVGVWDRSGKVSWSEPARWTMGLLDPADWKAEWIGLDGEEKTNWLSGTDWIWFPEGEPEKSAPIADSLVAWRLG